MADAIAALITDDPVTGLGFEFDCTKGVRTADNELLYPCSWPYHYCGQLLSGCIWSTRNALRATHPDSYLDILSSLTLNSILLHIGSSINPGITIDFLTLDDDDANIFNGTPHFAEITEGFSAHDMPAPVSLLDITYPNGLPERASNTGVTKFQVSVLPEVGELGDEPPLLHYQRTGEETYTAVPLQSIGENLYEAALPVVPCGDRVDFYISATTSAGHTVTSPVAAPTVIHRLYAGQLELVFIDEFESDQGWTVGADDDDATAGHWERVVPIGTTAAGNLQVQPAEAYVGTMCYVTGQHPGGDDAGANDVDGGKTTLISPVLDMSGNGVISYQRWFSNHAGAAPYEDVFVVEVTNDGKTWVNVETIGPDIPGVEGGWFHHEFIVSELVTPTDTVQVRFIASDYDPPSLVEAAVDAFYVYVYTCSEPCPADLDGNNVVDVSDLLQLLSEWGDCNGCAADITNDDVVNVSDLLELIAAWGECE